MRIYTFSLLIDDLHNTNLAVIIHRDVPCEDTNWTTLAINSTTAVAGKSGFTLASHATEVVEFMAKWLNLYPRTVPVLVEIFFRQFLLDGFDEYLVGNLFLQAPESSETSESNVAISSVLIKKLQQRCHFHMFVFL